MSMNKRFTLLFICAFELTIEPYFYDTSNVMKNYRLKSLFIYIDSFLGYSLLARHVNMACHIGLGMKLSPNRKFED